MENAPTHPEEHTGPHHPPVSTYLKVFGWLTAFTIIELAISFIPDESIKVPALVFFATLKAILVVMFYMHLKYDRFLYTVILAIGVFFALLIGVFLPLVQK